MSLLYKNLEKKPIPLAKDDEYSLSYPSKGVGYFLILLLIISSSHAFMEFYRDALIAFSALVIGVLLLHYRRKIPALMFLYIVFFVLWLLYMGWHWQFFNINTAIGFFCRIFIALGVMLLLHRRFFFAFIDVVYVLTCISLALFIIGLVFPVALEQLQAILSLAPNIFLVDQGDFVGWGRVNFLVYTFSLERLGQNHGFLWEPTAFAAILLLALMTNLLYNGIAFDQKSIVFLIGLLSTFSTTGAISIVCVAAFVMMNKKSNFKIGVFFFLIPVILFFLSQDFLWGKISREFERGDDISQVNTELTHMGNSRLSSFLWDMRDFKTAPFFGIGIFEETRYNGFQTLGSVNGLSDTLVRFGLLGTLVFLLSYHFSFTRMTTEQGLRGGWLFVLLLLILSWSERLTMLPLFMVFQFYVYTHNPNSRVAEQKQDNVL